MCKVRTERVRIGKQLIKVQVVLCTRTHIHIYACKYTLTHEQAEVRKAERREG